MTIPAITRNDGLTLGRCTIGHNAGTPFHLRYNDLVRHVLAIGATGSGKTVALKRIVESMIVDGIPVVAIDVLGDLSGLAVPARRDYLTQIGLEPVTLTLSDADRKAVSDMGEAYEKRVHARVLTPCSDIAERMALSPLAGRPKNFDELCTSDRDYLVLQADTAAANFMSRLGLTLKLARKQTGPDMVRGIITDALMNAWEENLDLDGIEGLKRFSAHLEGWGAPPLPKEALSKVQEGVRAMSVGAEALWSRGVSMDFDELLSVPDGKVPLVVINIEHLSRDQHPWVVSQVIIALSSWAASRGPVTGRPRVGLLIDELAGEGGGNALLPGANFRSLSGDSIRKVLRQGRHWDLSLLAGTQSPRDVDGKSFVNFTNRLIGMLKTTRDVDSALEGAQIRENSRDVLGRMIGGAKQGNLYALTASGGFESVQIQWLCTVHSKLSGEQFRKLYEMGVIKRSSDQPAAVRPDLVGSLTRFTAQFRERLDPKDRDILRAMADRYR